MQRFGERTLLGKGLSRITLGVKCYRPMFLRDLNDALANRHMIPGKEQDDLTNSASRMSRAKLIKYSGKLCPAWHFNKPTM